MVRLWWPLWKLKKPSESEWLLTLVECFLLLAVFYGQRNRTTEIPQENIQSYFQLLVNAIIHPSKKCASFIAFAFWLFLPSSQWKLTMYAVDVCNTLDQWFTRLKLGTEIDEGIWKIMWGGKGKMLIYKEKAKDVRSSHFSWESRYIFYVPVFIYGCITSSKYFPFPSFSNGYII